MTASGVGTPSLHENILNLLVSRTSGLPEFTAPPPIIFTSPLKYIIKVWKNQKPFGLLDRTGPTSNSLASVFGPVGFREDWTPLETTVLSIKLLPLLDQRFFKTRYLTGWNIDAICKYKRSLIAMRQMSQMGERIEDLVLIWLSNGLFVYSHTSNFSAIWRLSPLLMTGRQI
jgi:hypothetical protein